MPDKRTSKQMSRLMKKESAKKALVASRTNEKSSDENEIKHNELEMKSVSPNRLAFFRQYNTYQSLLEIYPEKNITAKDCFVKCILYIMRWFRKRLGEEAFGREDSIAFLLTDYPEPENYKDFAIEKLTNIYGFDFIDFETAYVKRRNAWLVRLTEPDNGQEGKDIPGRVFTTEIFVYMQECSVVLGIRENTREPEVNIEDSSGFRPGFVRDIFMDKDLILSEYGISPEYAFKKVPYILNGKSGSECEKVYSELINSEMRQMPILFVPGDFYNANKELVDRRTVSMLGYTHVIVWMDTPGKLFGQIMKNEEFAEVADEGQLIFYRSTVQKEFPSDYYETDTHDVIEEINRRSQKETHRKQIDFRGFDFIPSWWEISKRNLIDENEVNLEDIQNSYEAEIAKLNLQVKELGRDNDSLQRRFDNLQRENEDLNKEKNKLLSDIFDAENSIEELNQSILSLREELKRVNEEKRMKEFIIKGYKNQEKERCIPLLNMPSLGLDRKNEILKWIEKYYSEVIEIHPDAVKSLKDDNRNIDWHRLCMMIHYLAGYTYYRNDGGPAINFEAAREYDPEDSGYKAEPTSSGQGSVNLHKDKYTIYIKEKSGKSKAVTLDMHIKFGKGKDVNMIRIYFYYDIDQKKSIIGYMPGHLPTRKDSH